MSDSSFMDVLLWADRAALSHAFVLHAATGVAGRVERFYAGTPDDCYAPTENAAPVTSPVLLLDTGHSFVVTPGAFQELDPKEVATLAWVSTAIGTVVRTAAECAAKDGTPPDRAFAILRAVLIMQLNALGNSKGNPGDAL